MFKNEEYEWKLQKESEVIIQDGEFIKRINYNDFRTSYEKHYKYNDSVYIIVYIYNKVNNITIVKD